MVDSSRQAGEGATDHSKAALSAVEISAEMIDAGVFALRWKCPFDVAFPFGGEDEAVEAVLRAALDQLQAPPNFAPAPKLNIDYDNPEAFTTFSATLSQFFPSLVEDLYEEQ